MNRVPEGWRLLKQIVEYAYIRKIFTSLRKVIQVRHELFCGRFGCQ
jgi:hypothetical protein